MSGSAGPLLTMSSEVLVVAVIFLFVTVVFVVFLYLYAKHSWSASARPRRRRRPFVFASPGADHPQAAAARRGLDPAVLRALPVTVYHHRSSAQLECAVCLCEVSDGEEARLLPKCSHGFHLECIDMWFQSHSTCPLCRGPVDSSAVLDTTAAVEEPPTTSVLPDRSGPVAADSLREPDGEGRLLVIEIPTRQGTSGFASPSSSSSRFTTGGGKEMTKSPASARLRSLKRLWSRGKREEDVSDSVGACDVEQGFAAAASGGEEDTAPTTPN